MKFRPGDIARLNLSDVAEGHYYRDGDLVRIMCCYRHDPPIYEVLVLRANRIMHWLPTEEDLKMASPLEQLADTMNDEDEYE